MTKPKLLVVGGPTAVGKTKVAIMLAKEFGAEIFSADSRQVYKEMNIGVAKPTEAELSACKHHFISEKSIEENFTAGDFERECLDRLKAYLEQHSAAILVGGTGLYIKALVEGLDNFPKVSKAAKEEVDEIFQSGGIEALQAKLQKLDPDSLQSLDKTNVARLRRALEVCLSSDRPFSFYKGKAKQERPFEVRYIILNSDRAELYSRIDERCDAMLEMGLLKEVEQLYHKKHLRSLATVGYQEFFKYLDGEWTLQKATEKFKQHSRNYAKRQITWFKKVEGARWFKPSEQDEILKYASQVISSK